MATEYLGPWDPVNEVVVPKGSRKRVNQELTKSDAGSCATRLRSNVNQVNQVGIREIRSQKLPPNKKNPCFGGFHRKEEQLIRKYVKVPCLHLFSGSSLIGDMRVDWSHPHATHYGDLFEFLEQNLEELLQRGFKTVIYDPPYSERQADKYGRRYNIPPEKRYWYTNLQPMNVKTRQLHKAIEAIHPDIIITRGWRSQPWRLRGYQIIDELLVDWGRKRTFTLLQVFKRTEKQLTCYLLNNHKLTSRKPPPFKGGRN